LRNYPGSVEAITKLIAADLEHGLVQEGLANIELKFATVDHWGPKAVAEFQEIEDDEERARVQRRAFETAQNLLERTMRSS
jgi:hypothetical protein